VLWTLANPQLILPGDVGIRRIIAPYRDTANQRWGAAVVNTPVAGVDFKGNSAADGTGADRTVALNMAIMEANASAAVVEFRNTGSTPIYLLAGAQLRGTPSSAAIRRWSFRPILPALTFMDCDASVSIHPL
jgi:hypothetical protein